MENLHKMFEWDHNHELIEIECGKKTRIDSIEIYRKEKMESYIQNNHESNSSFCHFGIHKKNGELIGYTDLIYIEDDLKSAELCISIPDKKLRNRVYGMDSIIAILYFAFNCKNIQIIKFSTRIDNYIVINICKKIGIEYSIKHFNENGYSIDLAYYTIDKKLYDKIIAKLFNKNTINYYGEE